MGAGVKDIEIEQGATFPWLLTWKDSNRNPINLTGYSARMQIKAAIDATQPLVDLSTATNGGIVLGGAAGTITITIAASSTKSLTFKNAVYDLFLISSTDVTKKLLKGNVSLIPAVTKWS